MSRKLYTCECGCQMLKSSYKKHLFTKKHEKYMKMNNIIIKDMCISKDYFEEYFKDHFEEEYTVRQNKIIQKIVDDYDYLECEYSSTTDEEYEKYCNGIECLLKMRVNNYKWIYIVYNGSSFFSLAMCNILPDDDE